MHDDRITFALLLCRIYLRGLSGLVFWSDHSHQLLWCLGYLSQRSRSNGIQAKTFSRLRYIIVQQCLLSSPRFHGCIRKPCCYRNLHESNGVSLWWSIRKLSYRLVCNICWGLTQICVLLTEKINVRMKFSIFPKEKEVETHRGKKVFFWRKWSAYRCGSENLLSNDHISPVKAS